ncbi:hypothetical protein [Reyranella sp. CPCC 100927]|uniref:hypothetical protein n=1 Tax=Reyranella sp. CPCC 100927 TaxID=2599616 RepID=UPI0011B71055|nr:hypothetical protein [Reyranella sp. CPCC 100927]TWT13630.1 hypothetical protein FQU96_06835 [Reyranella sp. CPCC 100927]
MAFDDRYARALIKKARRGFSGYPVATIAYYGPDDSRATKVAVGIIMAEGEDTADLQRWSSEREDVRRDAGIQRAILTFIRAQGAQSIAMGDGILGCAHEEGIDYPDGTVCPQCPFWASHDRPLGKLVRRTTS